MSSSERIDAVLGRVMRGIVDQVCLDAAVVGLIGLDHPAARDCDETWLEEPRWREAARALCAHRRSGGRLGDLHVAARALEQHAPGMHLPQTTAAEAIIAVDEAASAAVVVSQARDRRWRLQLRRLARFLETASHADAVALPRVVDIAQQVLSEVHVVSEVNAG